MADRRIMNGHDPVAPSTVLRSPLGDGYDDIATGYDRAAVPCPIKEASAPRNDTRVMNSPPHVHRSVATRGRWQQL